MKTLQIQIDFERKYLRIYGEWYTLYEAGCHDMSNDKEPQNLEEFLSRDYDNYLLEKENEKIIAHNDQYDTNIALYEKIEVEEV